MKLPTRPTKKTDSRAKKFKGESCELDAIPPGTLRGMISYCVEQHMDQRQWDVLQAAEKSERELLSQLAENYTD
jgi:hypothetical protein